MDAMSCDEFAVLANSSLRNVVGYVPKSTWWWLAFAKSTVRIKVLQGIREGSDWRKASAGHLYVVTAFQLGKSESTWISTGKSRRQTRPQCPRNRDSIYSL